MNVKKSIGSIILIVVFVAAAIITPILFNVFKYSNQYDFKISDYKMDVVLDEYGDMHVVESVTNEYSNLNTVFYKQLIYGKNNSFSSPNDRSSLIKDVRVKVEDHTGVVFDSETSRESSFNFVGYSYEFDYDERGDRIKCDEGVYNCEMIFYYDAFGISDVTTFTYEYTIKGAVSEYGDISEFNWVLLGYQPMNVHNIEITVTLPSGNYNIKDMNTFFHGIGNASRSFVNSNRILITADKMVKNEQIEVRLLLDKNVFSSIRSENKVTSNKLAEILEFQENQIDGAAVKYNISYFGSGIIFTFSIIYLLYLAIYCYKHYDKEFPTDFYNEYYRELPASYAPAIMGYLYKFKEINDKDLTATLLDLIRRKYLILVNPSTTVNDKNPDYTIKLNMSKSQDDLTQQEKFLIKWFISNIGNGTQVSSRALKNYGKSYNNAINYQNDNNTWVALVKEEALKYDFFDNNLIKVKTKYKGLGMLAIGCSLLMMLMYFILKYDIAMILALPILFLSAAFIVYVTMFSRRSKNGNEDFVRWKAFKKFLEEFSSFEDYPVPSLIIWEHYLVYATSFGIADKVTSQLKLKFSENDIINSGSTFIEYYGLRYNNFYNINRTISQTKSSASRTIAQHNAATTAGRVGGGGSRGGGGGFSGGSSFGGGGGSFGGR